MPRSLLPVGPPLLLLVAGLVAAVSGVAFLVVWQPMSWDVPMSVLAVYAILTGIVYLALGLRAREWGLGGRVGHALLGLLYLLAGGAVFSAWLGPTFILGWLGPFFVFGVMWMLEGFTALFTVDGATSTSVPLGFALVSVLAGFLMVTITIVDDLGFPWWWFFGFALVLIGVLNVVRSRKQRTLAAG